MLREGGRPVDRMVPWHLGDGTVQIFSSEDSDLSLDKCPASRRGLKGFQLTIFSPREVNWPNSLEEGGVELNT